MEFEQFFRTLFLDAVRDLLSHLVVQNGVSDAAVVETRLTAADGGTFDADSYFRSLLQGEGHLGSIDRDDRIRYFTGKRRASWAG